MPPSGGPPERTRPPVATERSHRRHSPSSGPVALFVDWDNFAIGLRQEMPERPPDLGPILRWARRTGTLIVSRAYGEWRDATERLAIYNAGVDAVYAPVLPLGGSLAARTHTPHERWGPRPPAIMAAWRSPIIEATFPA